MFVQRALMLGSEIAQVTFKPSARCVILTYVQIPVRDRLELPATDRALILSHVVDKSMFPEPSWALSHICALRTLPHFTLCCSLRTTIRTLCHRLRQVRYKGIPGGFLGPPVPNTIHITRLRRRP